MLRNYPVQLAAELGNWKKLGHDCRRVSTHHPTRLNSTVELRRRTRCALGRQGECVGFEMARKSRRLNARPPLSRQSDSWDVQLASVSRSQILVSGDRRCLRQVCRARPGQGQSSRSKPLCWNSLNRNSSAVV